MANDLDYSSDMKQVLWLSRGARYAQMLSDIVRPAVGLGALFGRVPGTTLDGLSALDSFHSNALWLVKQAWQLRHDHDVLYPSRAVRTLAPHFPKVCTVEGRGSRWHVYDVAGIPVIAKPDSRDEDVFSPATEEIILSRARASGKRWMIDEEGEVEADKSSVPSTVCPRTVAIIERTRAHATCRAWVLWGPPRGGKSIAARQIAHALTGGWVRLCGAAARSAYAWRVARLLGAEAIILDDLDVNAGREDALLGEIEQAREHCRVIISTMNVLPQPGSDGDRKKHELRGAILGPGRAADERPVHFATLDASIRCALAPSVPEELRAPDLLAAYLVELQKRCDAHGSVTQADVDEMRERMLAVGDR